MWINIHDLSLLWFLILAYQISFRQDLVPVRNIELPPIEFYCITVPIILNVYLLVGFEYTIIQNSRLQLQPQQRALLLQTGHFHFFLHFIHFIRAYLPALVIYPTNFIKLQMLVDIVIVLYHIGNKDFLKLIL